MVAACVVCLLLALDPAPQAGPIYDLLEAERAAQLDTPEDRARWSNDLLTALRANPDEEWSTRVRAYEEAGSLLWRSQDYAGAAPILMEQWQESESRADSSEAVRSLDNLINLYGEANFPAQDVLDFYDATETWLQQPPPGQEAYYAKLTNDLWGERASRLRNFAQKADTESERQAFLQQAAYFDQLQGGATPVPRAPGKSLADIARAWFAKSKAAGTPLEGESPAPARVQTPTAPPHTEAPTPSPKAVAPAETPPAPLPPLETVKTPPKPAADSGLSSEWVIGICLAVIIAGWAAAAFVYLRGKR